MRKTAESSALLNICGACKGTGHSLLLPRLLPSRQVALNTHRAEGAEQPGGENPGCQLDSCATSASKGSDEDLQPKQPRLSGAQRQRSSKLVLLSFDLWANLPPSPLFFWKPSVSRRGR